MAQQTETMQPASQPTTNQADTMDVLATLPQTERDRLAADYAANPNALDEALAELATARVVTPPTPSAGIILNEAEQKMLANLHDTDLTNALLGALPRSTRLRLAMADIATHQNDGPTTMNPSTRQLSLTSFGHEVVAACYGLHQNDA